MMSEQQEEISQKQLFLLAVSFLTRIPVKLNFQVTTEALNQASRYFALVGASIAALLSISYVVLVGLFPSSIAVLLIMALGLLLTGAFHEDGLADVWDGFGGGWQVTDKLNIMKDSRLGTYGAAALVMALLVKFQSLQLLTESLDIFIAAMFLGHTLSRVVATSLIAAMDYVTEDAKAKVKPVAMLLTTQSYQILVLTGACTLLLVGLFSTLTWLQLLMLILVLLITRFVFIKWFNKQLSGYTGDCLGAAQQISELVIYLTLVSML